MYKRQINNNANNRIITGSGTANTLEAEATLTYDGTSTFELQPSSATPAIFVGDSNRTGAGQHLAEYRANWNGTLVGRIVFAAGDDTTNKDDGIISMHTTPSGGSSTERLRITSAGQMVMGATTSKAKFEIKDNGYSSSTVLQRISGDDANPYALIIANDTCNTAAASGLQLFVSDTGTHYILSLIHI